MQPSTPKSRRTMRHRTLRGVIFFGAFVVAFLVGIFHGDLTIVQANMVVLLLGLLGCGVLFIRV